MLQEKTCHTKIHRAFASVVALSCRIKMNYYIIWTDLTVLPTSIMLICTRN